MITQAQATGMLNEFEENLQRTNYDEIDKRPLIALFSYLKTRCSNATIYGSTHKLEATLKLQHQWETDRIGKPILADYGDTIVGFDPNATGKGSLTIHGIIKELRGLLVELPETITPPAPRYFPPIVAPGVTASITDAALDASVARVLAQKRELELGSA